LKGTGGIERNEGEAVRWYRAAVNQGHSVALHQMGVCHTNGKGFDKDVLVAACLFQMASEKGYQDAKRALISLKLNEVALFFESCSLIFHSNKWLH
jgi:TPR repeat protein